MSEPTRSGQPVRLSRAWWIHLHQTDRSGPFRQLLEADSTLELHALDALVTECGGDLDHVLIHPHGVLQVVIRASSTRETEAPHLFHVDPDTAQKLIEAYETAEQEVRESPTAEPTDVRSAPQEERPANESLMRDAPAALGRYQIQRMLGRGGMGIVYLANDTNLNREVAIKVLPGAMFAGEERVERLLREARIGASISHPSICQVLDAGQEAGEFYFVMEFLRGRLLSELLSEGQPLPVAQACVYAIQLFDALQYLASRAIVHRDIKPSNLMICAGDRVKLLDLGLVKDLGQQDGGTMQGMIMGTPSYMAPEQIADSRGVTPRTDLYAAGATLYQMLTGKTPYSGPGYEAIFYQVLSAAPPDPRVLRPDIPAPLALLVQRLLAKEPGDRPEHAEVLATLETLRERPEFTVARPLTAANLQSVVARIEQVARHLQDDDRDDLLAQLPVEAGQPRLGNYILEERIGPRALIATYRARHSLMGVPAIIRVLPPAFSQMAPERLKELLRQQGRLMQISMKCPQLSRMIDIGKAEMVRGNFKAVYYIVEDHLPGITLESRIEKGRKLRPGIARRFLGDALRGLAALHGQKLLHGNLHSGKCFLDPATKELRLCDLSLAGAAPEPGQGEPGTLDSVLNRVDWFGSRSPRRRQYIAPEVLSEGLPAGPPAEQFALGAIFIEALTGRFLRSDPNDLKLLAYVRADLEDRLREIAPLSRRLADVLGQMVATNSASRFGGVEEILTVLAAPEKAPPKRSAPPPRGKAPVKKRKRANPEEEYDVFISYRRKKGAETARVIVERLLKHKVRVFLDVDSLTSGHFDETLLDTIENTPHFVLILSEGSLDRCRNARDWLRREIRHAIETKRNLVPILLPGFDMPDAGELPRDLQSLPTYHAIPYDHVLFEGFISKLLKLLKRGGR